MRINNVTEAAAEIVEAVDGKVVLGLPLGLGKPNPLANALYRAADADRNISLTILTALSLTRPDAAGDFQQRFLGHCIFKLNNY